MTHNETDRTLPAWMVRMAEGRLGITLLSALEATVLPIPLEAVLVPLMVARPRHAIALALWAILGCLIGTAVLYGTGLALAEPVVLPLIEALGLSEDLASVEGRLMGGELFWTVLLLSVSPFPIQLASLGSGMIGSSFLTLMTAVAVARGGRYLGLGLLARWLGPRLSQMHIPRAVWWLAGAAVVGLFAASWV